MQITPEMLENLNRKILKGGEKMNIYYEIIKLADKTLFVKIITERYDKNPKIIIMDYQEWLKDQKEWNIEENKNNNN